LELQVGTFLGEAVMALLGLNKDGRLSLKSSDGTEEVALQPSMNDVLLLVDTSGSMTGNKIEQAKNGAIDFARSVNRRGCSTALAIFGDRAAMVCDPTADTQTFEKKIARLTVGLVGGTTNLAAGLHLAAKFERLNAVVVVTDGQPNSVPEALAAADALKQRRIDILCIGTDDADKDFLAELATRSDLALHVKAQNLRASLAAASQLLLGGGE
jgi:Mg-chelatase subunit ChlD